MLIYTIKFIVWWNKTHKNKWYFIETLSEGKVF